MVSANLQRIGNEFVDMIDEQDFTGFVALAGLGSVGGVLAEMFQDRVAGSIPQLNLPSEPTTSRGLVGSFLVKSLAAVLLGFAALRMGSGTPGLVLASLGVGAAIDSGVDLLEAGDRLRSSSPSSRSPSRSRRQSRPQPRRQPRRASRPSRRTSRSSSSSSSSRSNGSGSLMDVAT